MEDLGGITLKRSRVRLFKHSLFLAFLLTTALQAQPQIGGGVCTNSTLSRVYYYLLSGELLSGGQVYPYVELGKLVADGQGGVTGNSHARYRGLDLLLHPGRVVHCPTELHGQYGTVCQFAAI